LVELILCVIPVILAAFLLSDRPPTPPSNSMQRKSKATRRSTEVQGNLTQLGGENDLDDDVIVSRTNSSGILSLELSEINTIIKYAYIHTYIHTYLVDLLLKIKHTYSTYIHYYTYIHKYIHTYIHTYVHIYIRTHTYILTHTYIHTYIQR
jgi:hypothetical protein